MSLCPHCSVQRGGLRPHARVDEWTYLINKLSAVDLKYAVNYVVKGIVQCSGQCSAVCSAVCSSVQCAVQCEVQCAL